MKLLYEDTISNNTVSMLIAWGLQYITGTFHDIFFYGNSQHPHLLTVSYTWKLGKDWLCIGDLSFIK